MSQSDGLPGCEVEWVPAQGRDDLSEEARPYPYLSEEPRPRPHLREEARPCPHLRGHPRQAQRGSGTHWLPKQGKWARCGRSSLSQSDGLPGCEVEWIPAQGRDDLSEEARPYPYLREEPRPRPHLREEARPCPHLRGHPRQAQQGSGTQWLPKQGEWARRGRSSLSQSDGLPGCEVEWVPAQGRDDLSEEARPYPYLSEEPRPRPHLREEARPCPHLREEARPCPHLRGHPRQAQRRSGTHWLPKR